MRGHRATHLHRLENGPHTGANRERRLAILNNLYDLRISLLYSLVFTGSLQREQLHRKDRPGNQKNNRNAGPHQRTRTLLIFENGKARLSRRAEVHRVCDPVGEHEQSGKDVARQSSEKKVQKD